MKRLLVQLCILLALTLALPAQADIGVGEAIDRAGAQRMLSQRLAQSYLLMLIQPDSPKGQDRMHSAIARFEDNLQKLEGFTRAAKLRDDLYAVKKLWLPYKALAQAAASRENAEALLAQSDALLAAAHAYVLKLEALAGSQQGELVNISGRQRMLSQRIAKNYFAYYYKLGGPERIEALYEDLAEYQNMLDYLKASPLNSVEIGARLNRVAGQFAYASKGFDGLMQITGDRLIFVITGTTDAMLKNMDDVTRLYAAL